MSQSKDGVAITYTKNGSRVEEVFKAGKLEQKNDYDKSQKFPNLEKSRVRVCF